MATSPEEIQRQHDEAAKLVQERFPFAKSISMEEIPLSQKTCPLFELVEPNAYDKPCWTTRGQADIAKLADLVREGYNSKYEVPSDQRAAYKVTTTSDKKPTSPTTKTKAATTPAPKKEVVQPRFTEKDIKSEKNLWDPINAAVRNVAVCRPSHDAWGIHKIILLFCDDFVQRTYALPWWHSRPDIRQAVQPILDILNIPERSVVRMLLASLPPGVTIPVHEDSGAWVARTHRVHVPILVEHVDQILFRCGSTVENMERISTNPGHVFEMNNQAKHAVSNCSDDYRVHLILDYADADYPLPDRIDLEPGELLLQTRRSIDRYKDRGLRSTPSFFILGAQKAGTTSLYEYMIQHPLIVSAKRRETHCLDWRWNANLKTVAEQRKWCQQFYHYEELHRHPSCLTGDSTPSYLIDSRRVIPRLKQVFDWPIKFFVMLRNPVKRAGSHYAMVTSTEGTPAQLKARGSEWREKSFRQVVMDDLDKMHKCGLIPYWNMDEGTVDDELFESFSRSEKEDKAWDAYIKDIPLNTGSYSLLGRGLYELNLRPWLGAFDRSDFMVIQLERFKSKGVSEVMEKVWEHIGVPSSPVNDESPKNTRSYDPPMDQQLQSYLERFYEPHNRRLAEALGDDWNGVWINHEQENCHQQA